MGGRALDVALPSGRALTGGCPGRLLSLLACRASPCPPNAPPGPGPHAACRGSPWCSNHSLNGTVLLDNSNCSRESLTLLSDAHPGLLNVSLIRPYGRVTTPEGEPASHHEHAAFK